MLQSLLCIVVAWILFVQRGSGVAPAPAAAAAADFHKAISRTQNVNEQFEMVRSDFIIYVFCMHTYILTYMHTCIYIFYFFSWVLKKYSHFLLVLTE